MNEPASNITLTIGDVGQTVEVTGAAALLQTESTQVGASMNSKTLTDVPLGGQRNFAYLARLSPGVLPAEPGARDSANGGFSAGGVRGNGQNNFLLNGVDNNVNTIDFLNQTSYAVGPSVEAIGEMSVQTNGVNAEYGRAAGAVINVNLKSGTNQLHGSLFEILQNKDSERQQLDQQPGGQTARALRPESVRRHRGRSDRQEQTVHLRRLSGNAHCFIRRHPGPRLQQQQLPPSPPLR